MGNWLDLEVCVCVCVCVWIDQCWFTSASCKYVTQAVDKIDKKR